jgi:hypothetical protein
MYSLGEDKQSTQDETKHIGQRVTLQLGTERISIIAVGYCSAANNETLT